MRKGTWGLTICCMAAVLSWGMTGLPAAAAEENIVIQNETEPGSVAETAVQTEAGTAVQTEPETVAVPETEAVTESETVAETETSAAEARKGEMIFARCEDFINIRKGPGVDSDVVGKIYNNCMATILSEDGAWFEIQSGNAVGFVKSEYFATGDEAKKIAEEVAYNVAQVFAYELNVRALPDESSEVIDVAYEGDELEAVAIEGDWVRVALGGDIYGYVNVNFIDYKTYYREGETLEEEQARLEAEAEAAAEEESYEESNDASGSDRSTVTASPEYSYSAPAQAQPQTEAQTQPQTEAQTQPEEDLGDDSGDTYYDADTGEMKPFEE